MGNQITITKPKGEMTREQYYAYFSQVESKGYIIDKYEDSTSMEDLEKIQRQVISALLWNGDQKGKDLRTKI